MRDIPASSRAMLRFILDSKYQTIVSVVSKIAIVVESSTMGMQGFCHSVARRVHLDFYRGYYNDE